MKKPNDKAITAAKIVAGVAAALTLGANLTGCVYGPPPDYTSKEQTTASESKETTDPSKNQNEDVYGPPSDFTTEDNELVPVYGPPSDFETESNELPDVYGPPGDMG